jgi:hypothetical protein
MAEEGVPIVERRVGHLPGNAVRMEMGSFRHEMNLREVFAAFEHEEDHEPFEVTLRGHPEVVERAAQGPAEWVSLPAGSLGRQRSRRS